jgi:hypothetical protein
MAGEMLNEPGMIRIGVATHGGLAHTIITHNLLPYARYDSAGGFKAEDFFGAQGQGGQQGWRRRGRGGGGGGRGEDEEYGGYSSGVRVTGRRGSAGSVL